MRPVLAQYNGAALPTDSEGTEATGKEAYIHPDTEELQAQLEAATTARQELQGALTQLQTDNAIARHQSSLMRAHCVDLHRNVVRLKAEHAGLKAEQEALLREQRAEERVLATLEDELYRREQRLKDLKQQLQTASEQLKCKDLEDVEIEEEYQMALCACKDRQKRQKEVVAKSLQRYADDYTEAMDRVGRLKQELVATRRKSRSTPAPSAQSAGATGWFVAFCFGTAIGLASKLLLSSHIAVV